MAACRAVPLPPLLRGRAVLFGNITAGLTSAAVPPALWLLALLLLLLLEGTLLPSNAWMAPLLCFASAAAAAAAAAETSAAVANLSFSSASVAHSTLIALFCASSSAARSSVLRSLDAEGTCSGYGEGQGARIH